MTTRCLLAVIVLVAAVSGHGDAQQPDPKFGAATTAVVIDVVVRDAKGRPVTDLTRADFELLEDGVAQTLGDVTRVGACPSQHRLAPRRTGSAAPAAAPSAARQRSRGPDVSGHRLRSPHAGSPRAGVQRRAGVGRDQPGQRLRRRVSVGPVAGADPDLHHRPREVAQGDRRGGDACDVGVRSGCDQGPEGAGRPVWRGQSPERASRRQCRIGRASGRAMPRRRKGRRTGPPAACRLAFDRSAESWERLAREQQGFASLNALRAVIEGLSVLPAARASCSLPKGSRFPKP